MSVDLIILQNYAILLFRVDSAPLTDNDYTSQVLTSDNGYCVSQVRLTVNSAVICALQKTLGSIFYWDRKMAWLWVVLRVDLCREETTRVGRQLSNEPILDQSLGFLTSGTCAL